MIEEYAKVVMDLSAKLTHAANDLEESNSYYEATYRLQTIGISTPHQMRCLRASIGWGRMYVDAVEERMDLEGFRMGDDAERVKTLLQWWQTNDLDEESGLAHTDAMVFGRSYVTVSAPSEDDDDQDIPIIRVESPMNMWADVDPRTRRVTRAIRLYKNPDNLAEQWATLYLPDETVFLINKDGHWLLDPERPLVAHGMGRVPVVPIMNRERLADRHGSSEITEELRSFIDAASRTMMNMQAASELMAVPQRLLFGVDASELAPNGSPQEVYQAYMAQIMAIGDPQGRAEQFTAAELQNFVNVLQELSKHVASYTGLPPQYLSFSSDNPASAEAIKSAETRLVKKCERKSRLYGGSWEEVMRLATLVMEGSTPPEMQRMQAIWRDPATPTYASLADAAQKLYANGEGVIPRRRAQVDIGYSDEEIEQMEEWTKTEQDEKMNLAEVMLKKGLVKDPNAQPPPGQQSQNRRPPANDR